MMLVHRLSFLLLVSDYFLTRRSTSKALDWSSAWLFFFIRFIFPSLMNFISQLRAVYDVTIAYKNQCPSFLDNVFGVDPSEVHMHVRRIPIGDIPASETKAASWLINAFQMKDQLLSDFNLEGQFPNQLNEKELSTFSCLVTITVVVSLTAMFTYLTLFSLIWFKVYVGLSCVYLTIATCFNIKLKSITEYVNALSYSKKQKTG